MKILNTSDLHIGKKLMGRERYGEYRSVFTEISDICKKEGVELVFIAGDVFDTYTPSSEAEEIFYSGVKLLAETCAVLIISGNHDDYVRLTAAAQIAEELGVYIIGNNLRAVSCKKRKNVYPLRSGAGWVVFTNCHGEEVYINALPYPNEARFKEGRSDESFTQKMSRWIETGEAGKSGDGIPSVFLSHIFLVGGAVSDSEREIDLGGTRAVGLDLIPECGYCALGHLHKRQKIGEKAFYSGAPMRFSFDECGQVKSVNVFELDKNGVKNFKQVEITSIKNLVRLQANGVESALKLLERYQNDYVEMTLNLDSPLTSVESAELRQTECLISLKTNVKSTDCADNKISHKNKSSSELFSDYYKSRYDAEIPKELLALFLSLTEEE